MDAHSYSHISNCGARSEPREFFWNMSSAGGVLEILQMSCFVGVSLSGMGTFVKKIWGVDQVA